MLSLKDIRQYISDLSIAEDDNVYMGKLDNKSQKSIGFIAGRRRTCKYRHWRTGMHHL